MTAGALRTWATSGGITCSASRCTPRRVFEENERWNSSPRQTRRGCVCDLNEAFDLSQPTISHHLKVLHEAGLLDRDKRGVWVYYRARTEALASLSALIGDPGQEPDA